MAKIPADSKWKPTGHNLGEGGQAHVYVVSSKEDPSLRGAMKVLKAGSSTKALKRFHTEISAIQRLDHPNIIRVLDHSSPESEFQYYVMELHDGAKSLKEKMRDSNPFLRQPVKALRMFLSLTGVIRECAKNDVIHRDLSPANILVLPDESIRVIDFGICQMEGTTRITLVDEGLGTIYYISPECESGGDGEITPKSDIYSAGKILWSAVTGQQAFGRERPAFTTHSMTAMFPDQPVMWHLDKLLELTVRHKPSDRGSTDELERAAWLLLSAIKSDALPIELLEKVCSVCRVGQLEQHHSPNPFGPHRPSGVEWVACKYCGYWFAIDLKSLRLRLELKKHLT